MKENENKLNKSTNKLTKKGLVVLNLLISMVVAFCVVAGIGCFVGAYKQPPKNLQEATGIIAKFNQRDNKWYDYLAGPPMGNYFAITFEDGMYFEASGMFYDNIDKDLFEIIRTGEEIKITYSSSKNGPNKICSIEYRGVNYLIFEDVLGSYKKNKKDSIILGITFMVVVAVGGIGLFIVNYKYRKNIISK